MENYGTKYIILSLSIMFLGVTLVTWYNIKSLASNFSGQNVKIGLLGDTMLGRQINNILDQTNYSYIWTNVVDILKNNDFNLANLETTLTMSQHARPKVFNFKAAPDKVKSLQLAHINIVNLANNHILDFGELGLVETIQTLKKANIGYVGAGKNSHEAQKPFIIEKNNIKIGIIGFTDNEPNWLAQKDKPGTNYIEVGDLKTIKRLILDTKKKVDFLIVTCHWGPNWRQVPSKKFQDFAHQLIDLGVDIIHGHSAHIFQGVEIYKLKVILYDTGDFIDDYVVDPILRNDMSFIFNVELSKYKIEKIKLIPILIKNYQVSQAIGKNYEIIMTKMQELSNKFGTQINDAGEIHI